MARKPSITLKIGMEELKLKQGKIKELFTSEVRPFKSSSGAYIPMQGSYANEKVLIVVLDEP